LAAGQSDQMSLCEKIAQNLAQPILVETFVTNFSMEKGDPKLGLLMFFLKKTAQSKQSANWQKFVQRAKTRPKVNNRPIGKKSPKRQKIAQSAKIRPTGKKSPNRVAYSKKMPNRLKFAQSGHPGVRSQICQSARHPT
jgi:hypothetical protein